VIRQFEDRRVRSIRQQNRGTAHALQTGLDAAIGRYVAFLDQDDLWEPGFLAAHVDLLTAQPEVALTFSAFSVIDETGRETGLRSRRVGRRVGFQDLLIDFVIGGNSNIVVRRAEIHRAGGFDPAFRCSYNIDLCLRVALLAPDNIAPIPRELMRYRRHAGQMSRNIAGMVSEWEQILRKFHLLAPALVAPVEKRAQSNQLRYFARLAYEGADYQEALRFLRRGFTIAPWTFLKDPRNWLTAAACSSGALLPPRLHFFLERLAGFQRSDPR
jgi:glycosyltransferase involved in cell wall biosynthesis